MKEVFTIAMKAKFFTNTDNSVIIYLRQEEIRHTGVLFPVMRLSEVAVMTGIRPVRMNSLEPGAQGTGLSWPI